MYHRFITAILFVLLLVVSSPVATLGQTSIDSLKYLLDNELIRDDAERYRILSRVIQEPGDDSIKIAYCDQAIELARKLDMLPALPYLEKGEVYLDSGMLPWALECFFKAAEYSRTNNEYTNLGRAFTLMAEAYNKQGNHENEKIYLRNAIDIFEQEKDSLNLAITLQNLGYLNYSTAEYDTALILFDLTGDLFQKLTISGDPNIKYVSIYSYFYCLGNTGLVYSRLADFDKAEKYLLEAIDTLEKLGDKAGVSEFSIEYAGILWGRGETGKAISRVSGVLSGTDDPVYESAAAKLLARIYEASGRFDSAYYFQSVFIAANDSITNSQSIMRSSDLRTAFELARKQAEVDVLEKDRLIQKIVIRGLVIIVFLAIGLITLYYYNLQRSRKLTAALEERGILLEQQSSELKQKNERIIVANEELKELYEVTSSQKEEIISSINYARRIQKAILPPKAYITELITENFIFYKPKEIVSGDFYWVKQINQYVILACADCSGHGVPGAFMSMLGISYLNEIVRREEINQASQVLNELRKTIKNSLRQTGKKGESRDGIDMALCVIDTKNCMMQYSGAFNPLCIVRNSGGKPELKEIKADRMPVGVHFSGDKSFTNHEIQLEIGDTFYISTDGFIDQDGGDNGSRFGSARYKKLLLEIHDHPLYEQKELLERTLAEWMGEHPQRDDILVIGARV